MAGKELDVFIVRDLIRRLQLGQSGRSISKEMQISRDAVKHYKELCEQKGWLKQESLPSVTEIQTARSSQSSPKEAPSTSTVLPYKEQVEELLKDPKMSITVILQRLRERGYEGSYSSVNRFVQRLQKEKDPEGFCRIEVPAGAEAQVDFGFIGMLYDPVQRKERKAWAFMMTLSHSRHFYAEIVFDQSSWTWLRLHEDAFKFFEGVPKKVVLDNLKAGIIKAAVHDPLVQRSYLALAEHYGFVISPCRPYTPHHKGKVERTIRYLKQNFLPGRTFRDIEDANEQLSAWNEEIAALRIHGTTGWRPLDQYEEVERKALLALPQERFEPSMWKEAKLHPDCHIQVEKSFYSAPFRLIGQQLMAQIKGGKVYIFNDLELVATHDRAWVPKSRETKKEHLPPDKAQLWMATPQGCIKQAEKIGPSASKWMRRLLENQVTDRLRSGLAALRLAEKYSPQRLETACERSLDFDEIKYGTLKRILVNDLDKKPWKHLLPPPASTPVTPTRYARHPGYYFDRSQEVH